MGRTVETLTTFVFSALTAKPPRSVCDRSSGKKHQLSAVEVAFPRDIRGHTVEDEVAGYIGNEMHVGVAIIDRELCMIAPPLVCRAAIS